VEEPHFQKGASSAQVDGVNPPVFEWVSFSGSRGRERESLLFVFALRRLGLIKQSLQDL
jgi:hypothetical protein